MNTPLPRQLASMLASLELLRYPRTQHLEGSRLQSDDDRQTQALSGLAGCHVVIEEKLDGANSAISYTEGGQQLLQSRGHYLLGSGRERQFAPLHTWAQAHEDRLLERLQDRYIMYGEWMYAKHSVFYDNLPHYFNEFDVWDRQEQCFLSTPRRHALLQASPVLSVPVLYSGLMPTREADLLRLIGHSLGKSRRWRESFEVSVQRQKLDLAQCWQQTDQSDLSEGLYLKLEDTHQVLGRFKWVRPDFVQTIMDSGSHHSTRPLLPNALAAGVDLFAPLPTVSWADLGLQTLHSVQQIQNLPPATNRSGKTNNKTRQKS